MVQPAPALAPRGGGYPEVEKLLGVVQLEVQEMAAARGLELARQAGATVSLEEVTVGIATGIVCGVGNGGCETKTAAGGLKGAMAEAVHKGILFLSVRGRRGVSAHALAINQSLSNKCYRWTGCRSITHTGVESISASTLSEATWICQYGVCSSQKGAAWPHSLSSAHCNVQTVLWRIRTSYPYARHLLNTVNGG